MNNETITYNGKFLVDCATKPSETDTLTTTQSNQTFVMPVSSGVVWDLAYLDTFSNGCPIMKIVLTGPTELSIKSGCLASDPASEACRTIEFPDQPDVYDYQLVIEYGQFTK